MCPLIWRYPPGKVVGTVVRHNVMPQIDWQQMHQRTDKKKHRGKTSGNQTGKPIALLPPPQVATLWDYLPYPSLPSTHITARTPKRPITPQEPLPWLPLKSCQGPAASVFPFEKVRIVKLHLEVTEYHSRGLHSTSGAQYGPSGQRIILLHRLHNGIIAKVRDENVSLVIKLHGCLFLSRKW